MGDHEVAALKSVSIEIQQNEYVAFIGSSGSGKSTIMNIIGCLDQQSSGRYYLNGRDTVRMGASELARVRNEEIGFEGRSGSVHSTATVH
jgi:ABC-type lipoprotein export system ATPase subunit